MNECPRRKKVYATYQEARTVAKRKGNPPGVEAYRCPDCKMFHIGRGPKGRDKPIVVIPESKAT